MAGLSGLDDEARALRTILSLDDVRAGSRGRIVEIAGGAGMVRRFLALGLAVGTEVRVSHERSSGVVVACGGGRVALGADMAERVRVELID